MVNKTTKYLLEHRNLYDPLLVSKITGDSEEACWQYLSDLDMALNEAEKTRNEQAIRQEAKDWAFALEEANDLKRQILLEKLKAAKAEQNEAKVAGLMQAFRLLTNRTESLSPELIARAKEFPITDLIEHKRFMAQCPFHPDQTASLYLKNNYYHCFGCGASGDVIKFVMERDGLTFQQAINKLT